MNTAPTAIIYAQQSVDSTFGPYIPNPINDNWLLKCLRLLYSKKSDSGSKLKRAYKESVENETSFVKITQGEALADDIFKEDTPPPVIESKRIHVVTINQNTPEGEKKEVTRLKPDIKKSKVSFFNIFDEKSQFSNTATTNVEGQSSSSIVLNLMASLNCCICNKMTSSINLDVKNLYPNNLIECKSCKLLYHQTCHKPPVLEHLNDLGKWSCSRCSS